MEINKKLDGTELTVALVGRLDTTTSPELEAAISNDLNNITSLVFDFADLEYISSAGLRVLLACQKVMNKNGKMVVKNVKDDIQEVFDITGFNDILTIE